MPEKRTIILVGQSGDGKSTLANVLTGIKTFKESDRAESCTQEIQSETFTHEGIEYTVVDTPGINGTDFENENKVYMQIVKAIYQYKDSLNQILFITSGRFMKNNRDCYKLLFESFLNDINSFITIVKTKFNYFDDEGKCQKDIIDMISRNDRISEIIKSIKSCDQKVIHVNNNNRDKDREESRKFLLNKLKKCNSTYQYKNITLNPGDVQAIENMKRKVYKCKLNLTKHKKNINIAMEVGNKATKVGEFISSGGAAISEPATGAFGAFVAMLGKGTTLGTEFVQSCLEKKYKESLKEIERGLEELSNKGGEKLERSKLEGLQDFEKLENFLEECVDEIENSLKTDYELSRLEDIFKSIII